MAVALAAAVVLILACAPAEARRVADPRLDKLDSHLQAVAAGRRTAKREGIAATSNGVVVDVYVRGRVRQAASRLRALGMTVVATSRRFHAVEGTVPRAAMVRVAGRSRVRALVSVPPPVVSVGAKDSQGDAAHRGPQARADGGPAGAGVSLGVISDSINQVGGGVAGSQASGDLPADVTILSDKTGGSDEGRAMAEIAYDEAPGIDRILFGSAFTSGGALAKAQLIDQMVQAGAGVIADDTAFMNEPFFQDGPTGLAVDRARAAGTAYFTAAGNFGKQGWEGRFSDSGTDSRNDFDPGSGTDLIQSVVNVPPGGTLTVYFQWDEPFGKATTDLDLYLTTLDGTVVSGTQGESDNLQSGIPFEGASFTNPTGSPIDVGIGVRRAQGTGAPLMKYIANGDFGSFSVAEYPTDSDTISPGAATAAGSITVGAVPFNEPGLNDAEPFSSRGPKTILFDTAGNRLAQPEVRQKPDLVAADGVSTTLGPPFDPFFGTSAAVPSAAGLAALLRSANPALTPDAVRAILTDPRATTDCNPPGEPDADCGFGFPFADAGVGESRDTTPPAIAPVVPAADGLDGWHVSDVPVSWTVSDPESPLMATDGCGSTTVVADTPGRNFLCTATSVGGAASQGITVKRDASPPAAPVFAGIRARTYQRALLPPSPSVRCSASDPTSGVAGCDVSGYSGRIGHHVLRATARNGAGLTSTVTLAYRVIHTRPAISRLSASRRIGLRRFLARGLLARVTVARGRTRLMTTLRGPHGVVVARISRVARAGRARLRVRPRRSAAALLAPRRRTVLELVVSARPRVGAKRTLRRTVVVS